MTDLVYVHVALCTASGLEHDEGEVVDELSGNDLREKISERIRRRRGDVRRLPLSVWRHRFLGPGHSRH